MAVLDPDFGDGIGRGKGLDGAEMDFIPVPLAKEIINAYTLAFFDAVLRGRADARGYLGANHYEAEVDYQREPARTDGAEKAGKTGDAASPGR